MNDDKLALDEERRAGQHEAVKAQVEGEVHADIAEQAAQTPPRETDRVNALASDFRARAVDEVVDTEREVTRGRTAARVSQVIDYLFFVLYGLLGFVRFIVAVTDPFYRPFRGIVASPSTDAGHTLMVPLIIAIVVYLLLHLAINGLLRMLAHRKTAI